MRKLACAICLTLVALSMGCSPVLAHTAAEMGIAPDQYDLGIPVFWPYHAVLMSSGFILLLSGFVVTRFHKTSGWYRSHRILESVGGVLVIAGLVVSITMITISGAPHLRYTHDLLGIITIILILCTLLLGYLMTGFFRGMGEIRTIHRWLGGISIVLVAANIVLGISMMTMVLAQ
jgi:hypothetical protein